MKGGLIHESLMVASCVHVFLCVLDVCDLIPDRLLNTLFFLFISALTLPREKLMLLVSEQN